MNHEEFSIMKRIILILLLVALFYFAIDKSFMQLLKPQVSLNSKTLYQISNPYEEDEALKGNIYDRNGLPLLANVQIDSNGTPIMADGSYQLLSELDSLEQQRTPYKRVLIEEEHAECWSNILPVLSGGLDSAFADILQDIPLNAEDDTNVTLTIDKQLQEEVYQILSDRDYSSAVVMDCHTGDILSMVSRPSYDYNLFRQGLIPYTTYMQGSSFRNNVDNAHDCIQDYYKSWKSAYILDNTGEKNLKNWREGSQVQDWLSNLSESGMICSEQDAQQLLNYWNQLYGVHMSLVDCMEVDFRAIYQEEAAFYQETSDPLASFPFSVYEPEALGNGMDYIPFAKVRFSGVQGNETQVRYIRLCYGSNNFIYSDCQAAGFDPNFSFQNGAIAPSAPGSCFKILLSALLIDEVNESMISDSGDIRIGNQYYPTERTAPLPTVETAQKNHSTLREALVSSSNQYFSMAAMSLDAILHSANDSYTCSYQSVTALETESLRNSGAFLLHYYQDKFHLNQPVGAYFHITEPKILACLDSLQIAEAPQEGDLIYDDTLWYTLDETGEIQQAYTNGRLTLAQKIGDTAYGQGYDRVSPMFMAMSIGKCLTGTMYTPNVLQDVTIAPEVIGEDFDRGQQTVSMMQTHLEAVYDAHTNYVPDVSFDMSSFHYYSKTGTSSVDKGEGTQNTYGLFAEYADYPTQSDDAEKYQTIWYVGAVSDETHCYAIVLRSVFDNDSYSLKREYLQIVDALYQNGYLS